VIHHSDGSIVGVCRCESWDCEDLRLAPGDLTCYDLSWSHLSRAACKALGASTKSVEFGLPYTRQLGAWSVDAVPLILTLQSQACVFRQVVAELVARLRGRFILLAPSPKHFDIASQELLTRVDAAFFALDAYVVLMPAGNLQSNKPPGELFAQFQPEPKAAADGDLARSAFALLQQLDSESPSKPPSVLTVFRLYCVDNLTASQVARKCACSKTTVVDRLNLIRAKTGMPPERLRAYSAHLNHMQDDLRDSRARRIKPKNLIYDEEEPHDT